MGNYLKGGFWGIVIGAIGIGLLALVVGPVQGEGPPPALADERPVITQPETVTEAEVVVAAVEAPALSQDPPSVPAASVEVVPEPVDLGAAVLPESATHNREILALALPKPEAAPEAPFARIASAAIQNIPAPTSLIAPSPEPTAPALAAAIVPTAPPPAEDVAAVQPEPVAAPEPVITAPATDPAPTELAQTVLTPQPAEDPQIAPLPVQATDQDVQEAEITSTLPRVNSLITGEGSSGFVSAPQSVSTVRINRPTAATTEETPATAEAEPDATVPDQPLQSFAAPFSNPENAPLIGVILIDTGTAGDLGQTLSQINFNPTIVVDPLTSSSETRAATYRSLGQEVALKISIPIGAEPSDVEVAYQAALGIVPEATLLYSTSSDVISGDRRVTSQIMAILAQEGRGFVALEQGLGGVIQQAFDASVPASPVFRALDVSQATEDDVFRTLDQAALRARQSGDLIIAAPLTREVLLAIDGWASVGGGDFVVGPASAVLKQQIPVAE